MILLDILLVLVGGYVAGRAATLIRLPALVGMLVYGIVIGPFVLDILSDDFIAEAPTVSVIALIAVITSSFFAIDLAILRRDALTIGLVGTAPGIVEGLTVMILGVLLLGLSWTQGGILGFTIAVVSPAVVVPTMIRLKEQGWGMDKGIPVLLLAATNLDGIVAIILWLVFMTLELGGGDVVEVALDAATSIGLGGLLGGLVGYGGAKAFDRALGMTPQWLRIVVFLGAALLVFAAAGWLGLNAPATLLVYGLVFVNVTRLDMGGTATAVKHIWAVAAIFLFVLIGSIADLEAIWTVGLVGLVVIAVGVVARVLVSMGVLHMAGSPLDLGERLFVGLGTTGKATIQATLAPLVVAYGVANGEVILAVAVMSIIVMAPVASTIIELTHARLLKPPSGTVSGEESASGHA